MPKRPPDDVDRKLLALLMADARQSTTVIARKLGLARTTVHERIARLEKDGVVAGYTALVNSRPESETAQALVLVAITQKQQKPVVEALKRFPEIKLCLAINGEFDLMLAIEAPLNADVDAVIDEVVEIPGVVRSQSLTVLSTKFDRRPSRTP